MRDVGSIPGWGRSPGDGNGNPLQYSCLGNPMDRCHSLWGCKESDTTEHTHKSISMAGLQMRNWGSHYGEPGTYLPRCLGPMPRTVPMSPAAPHASPVWFLAGPREGCSEGHWQNNCGQLALEKGLILLSKLFISSSRSRQLPAPWKRNTGLFTGEVWAPLWKFLSMCLAPHACTLWDHGVCCPAYWFGILSGCEQKDRAERHTPTPSTSWLLGLCPGY